MRHLLSSSQGQIIEYDPAYLSLIGWLTKLKGTIFLMPVIHLQTALLLCIACAYAFFCRVPGPDSFPVLPVFNGSTFGVSLVRIMKPPSCLDLPFWSCIPFLRGGVA